MDDKIWSYIVNVVIAIISGVGSWFSARYKNKQTEFEAIVEANRKLREDVMEQLEVIKKENKELKEKIEELEEENRQLRIKLMDYQIKQEQYEKEIIDYKVRIQGLETEIRLMQQK